LGTGAFVLFFILIAINKYGDLIRWTKYSDASRTIMSMFNVTKYPPSLLYLLMTLVAPCSSWQILKLKRKTGKFLLCIRKSSVFLLHPAYLPGSFNSTYCGRAYRLWLAKHGLADVYNQSGSIKRLWLPLWVVYLIWIGIILLLYPYVKDLTGINRAIKKNGG